MVLRSHSLENASGMKKPTAVSSPNPHLSALLEGGGRFIVRTPAINPRSAAGRENTASEISSLIPPLTPSLDGTAPNRVQATLKDTECRGQLNAGVGMTHRTSENSARVIIGFENGKKAGRIGNSPHQVVFNL